MKWSTFMCHPVYNILHTKNNNASVTIILYYQNKQLIIYMKNTGGSLVFKHVLQVQLHLLF